jgi:hypothetical protein
MLRLKWMIASPRRPAATRSATSARQRVGFRRRIAVQLQRRLHQHQPVDRQTTGGGV